MVSSRIVCLKHLPTGMVLEEAPITTEPPSIYAIEERLIERAVDKRKHEFRTGRRLARQALKHLDTPACALPSGAGREPIWPAHLVGSISHNASRCVVAVGLRASFDGVGIDIEADRALPPGVADMVFTEEEQRWWGAQDSISSPDTLTFSAKESIFKCLFPLVGEYFDFQDVSVQFEPGLQRFTTHLAPRLASVIHPDRLHGLYRQAEGQLLTLVYLGASANPR